MPPAFAQLHATACAGNCVHAWSLADQSPALGLAPNLTPLCSVHLAYVLGLAGIIMHRRYWHFVPSATQRQLLQQAGSLWCTALRWIGPSGLG